LPAEPAAGAAASGDCQAPRPRRRADAAAAATAQPRSSPPPPLHARRATIGGSTATRGPLRAPLPPPEGRARWPAVQGDPGTPYASIVPESWHGQLRMVSPDLILVLMDDPRQLLEEGRFEELAHEVNRMGRGLSLAEVGS